MRTKDGGVLLRPHAVAAGLFQVDFHLGRGDPVAAGRSIRRVDPACALVTWALGLALLGSAAAQAQSIVGQVRTAAGAPVQGVLVTATRLFPLQRVTDSTDASGNYSVGGALSGSYTVAPTKSGYTFAPASTNVTVVGGNVTANFTVAAGPPPSATTLSASAITSTNAQLNGSANPNGVATRAFFQYGPTASYGSVTAGSALGNGNSAVAVGQVINGLSPGVTYHYRLVASDELGQSFGGDVSFSDAPAAPGVTTLAATGVNPTSAILNGSVNPQGAATTVRFEYGTTPGYGSVSSSTNAGSGSSLIPVGIAVTGLLNGTNYHFRIVASNSVGQSLGGDLSFETLSGIPTVATLEPTASGATSMKLNGSVNPHGASATVWFEVGSTTNYGNLPVAQNVGSGTTPTNFNQQVIGLTTGATYHYRAVAITSFGTNYGSDVAFTPFFGEIAVGLPGVYDGSVAWGDYDNDGRLDLLLTGGTSTGTVAQIWRNTGGGFTNINAGLPGVGWGSVAWGDYDNDGWLDILLTGYSYSYGTFLAQVWRNTGSGFTNINAGLPGVFAASAAWGDYDNDGRPDILLTGYTSYGTRIAQVWRNTGSGFVLNTNALLMGIADGSVAWGDYDNDGWLDILLAGFDWPDPNTAVARVYRNNRDGTFTDINAGLPGVYRSSVAWGDYDNDGRLDVLLTGFTSAVTPITQVWRNTASGFVLDTNVVLPAVAFSAVAWGDFDNDGRLDILLMGTTGANDQAADPSGAVAQLWRNTGNGFVRVNVGLTAVCGSNNGNGSLAWADYDNDGRLDILLTGWTGSAFIAQVLRNHVSVANSPPIAPSGLNVTVSNLSATLTWSAAADGQTPAAGLSYNVRIGTTPGGSDVLSSESGANGFHRVPQLGNASQRLSTVFNNLTVGTPYFWSVQAVDGAFAGSPFAPEGSFKLLPVPVSVTAASVVPGDLNGDGIVSPDEFAAVLAHLNGNAIVSQSELDLVLSNYFPNSPWLYLTNVAGLGGSNVSFALSNSTAGAFSVEYTTNLVDWLLLGPATPRYEFIDTNVPASPQRSYRLRWP